MNQNINFREIHLGEEAQASKLVMESFNEFIAPGYSSEGVEEFSNYVKPDSLKDRLLKGDFSFIAICNKEIVGVIEVRNLNHISLLFVKKEYHKMGIAQKLTELSITKAKDINPSIEIIEVNSSPYAVKIYKNLGFVSLDTEQVVNGIKFIPMQLLLE